MNKKIVYLTVSMCAAIALLCSCTASSGDSLLEVVAGVAGSSVEESSDVSSMISSEPESSIPESSEPAESSKAASSEDDSLDITYPEVNYSTAKKAYVNTQTDPLTMRTNPSSYNYSTVMMIPKGAEITVKGETGSFYFVEYNGKLGWVSANYVKFADSASSAASSEE